MFGLPAWLLVFPVLGFLIFIHELGHFLTAKWFGITVKEFGFGFPPRIAGFKFSPNGTIYSLNWIPLGGFVRMVGEHGEEIESGKYAGQKPDRNVILIRRKKQDGRLMPPTAESEPQDVSFGDQSVLKRAIVLSAGSFMNLLFPVIVFSILFTLPQDTIVGTVVVNGVAPGSPAAEAGLRPGDAILAVDGEPIDNHVELIQTVMAELGSPTTLTVRRGIFISGMPTPQYPSPDTEIITLTPRLDPPTFTVVEEVQNPEQEISLAEARRYNPELQLGDTLTQGAIGIAIGTTDTRIVKRSYPVWEAVPMSFERILDVVLISKNGVTRWAAGGPDPGLAGPVGIARVTGQVAQVGISPLFEFMALISISLGIVNILPIPALDGGRLLFVIIEWVRRGKRISPQREGLVHLVGFVVLISLIVVISYFDIIRLLNGESLIR